VTFDIYVDARNRLARLHQVVEEPGLGTSVGQVDFSDDGVHVNVTAPPADQVAHESDITPHT
jgi:hypothetical protein